jgi:hypothetical protein
MRVEVMEYYGLTQPLSQAATMKPNIISSSSRISRA